MGNSHHIIKKSTIIASPVNGAAAGIQSESDQE